MVLFGHIYLITTSKPQRLADLLVNHIIFCRVENITQSSYFYDKRLKERAEINFVSCFIRNILSCVQTFSQDFVVYVARDIQALLGYISGEDNDVPREVIYI